MTTTSQGRSATTAMAEQDNRALPQKSLAQRLLSSRATWILLLDIAVIALFTVLSPNGVFLSPLNIRALMLSGTEALLLALGMSMLLGAGEFDLSLGANLVLSSVVGALVMVAFGPAGSPEQASNVGLILTSGLLACVATGIIFGAANGVLVAFSRINSLIATLGMLGLGTGIALVLTKNGQDITGFPAALQAQFGLKTIGAIPVPAILALVSAALLWAVIRYTRYGRHTLAIGSSRSAAERAGLRVRPHILSLFILAGALAGLAGYVDIAQYTTTIMTGHPNDALQAVTAVVIGGTLLEGGRISIIGTLWGVTLAVILQNGLVIIGVSSAYQLMAVGGVLIIAVGLDRLSAQRRATGT